jgi:hypothetical protein
MFANIKNKVKLPKKKDKADKPDKKANAKFYEEHIEEFKFFVKYYPVFQNIAIAVGKEEIAKLNKAKPCAFRQESDIPFRCECEICANNGEKVKTLKECKECKASKTAQE